MNIGWDVDETLLEFVKPLVDFLATQRISVPSYEKTYCYDLWRVWDCTKKEAFRQVGLFYGSPAFLGINAYEGLPELVHDLSKRHKHYAITSRSSSLEIVTRTQIERNFPDLFADVLHTGQYSLDSGNGMDTKGTLAKKLGIKLFIEDSLSHAEEVASYGVRVLLLTRPWNVVSEVPLGVTRIDDLREIPRYINGRR